MSLLESSFAIVAEPKRRAILSLLLDAWLVRFRRFWSKHVDALERHLDRMGEAPTRKGRKRP